MADNGVVDFVQRARLLRDYVVYSGSEEGTDLIKALKEFDENPDLRNAEALSRLREATRKACRTVEPYTLTQVLNDRSPVRFGPSRTWMKRLGFSGFVVLVIGVVLLLSALHYTRWSTRAEVALEGIDDLARNDYSQLLRDFAEQSVLVEPELLNAQTTPALGGGALDDFIETIDQLKYFHVRQNDLFTEANSLLVTHRLLAWPEAFLRNVFTGIELPFLGEVGTQPANPLDVNRSANSEIIQNVSEITNRITSLIDGKQSVDRSISELKTELGSVSEALEGLQVHLGSAPSEPILELYRMNVAAVEKLNSIRDNPSDTEYALHDVKADLEKVIAVLDDVHTKAVGWPLDSGSTDIAGEHFKSYVDLRETWLTRMGVTDRTDPERKKALFQSKRQQIAGLLDLTNRWYFPLVYGALGAIIFSLSRHLNNILSAPPLESTILRVLFASFAAISISMIFIPSSAFSIGDKISPTFVFLLCFIFGYSIDSFLILLRRVDTGISERLMPS